MIDVSKLYLGHFSLNAEPEARFSAAAGAGFQGISLLWPEVCAARAAEGGLGGVIRRLDAANIAAPQMEVISLPGGQGLKAFGAAAREIVETSVELGCEVVHAAALDPSASFEELVEGFGVLAEACIDAGLACGVEFVPFLTPVPDLATAMGLVRAVNLAGAGIVLDSLHFFRSGAPWEELQRLRPGDVISIQINDGPIARPTEDYYAEAMGLRLLPGDGKFDLDRFLAVTQATGATAPITTEIMNLELYQRPAAEAAKQMAAATRDLLARLAPDSRIGRTLHA